MAIKITITSTKGGVGKTTLCANLAGILADLGQASWRSTPTSNPLFPATTTSRIGRHRV